MTRYHGFTIDGFSDKSTRIIRSKIDSWRNILGPKAVKPIHIRRGDGNTDAWHPATGKLIDYNEYLYYNPDTKEPEIVVFADEKKNIPRVLKELNHEYGHAIDHLHFRDNVESCIRLPPGTMDTALEDMPYLEGQKNDIREEEWFADRFGDFVDGKFDDWSDEEISTMTRLMKRIGARYLPTDRYKPNNGGGTVWQGAKPRVDPTRIRIAMRRKYGRGIGRGWWGQPRKHSAAAKRGRRRRR